MQHCMLSCPGCLCCSYTSSFSVPGSISSWLADNKAANTNLWHLSSRCHQKSQLWHGHRYCPSLSFTRASSTSGLLKLLLPLLEDAVVNSITVEVSHSCTLNSAQGLAGVSWSTGGWRHFSILHIHKVRSAKWLGQHWQRLEGVIPHLGIRSLQVREG